MVERIWLKKMRISRNLTQLEVSKLVGIKRSYYTMIEQGKRNPSVDVAKKISEVFQINWTYFFNTKGNESTLFDLKKRRGENESFTNPYL